MSDPDTLPAGVHPEAELLPWYATGALGEDDRRRVARHLESCRECSRELEGVTEIRHAMSELSRLEAEPSPEVYRSVMARVAADTIARDAGHQDVSWAAALDRWFRSLLMPRWVPTLAAVLLVAQMSLLLWITFPPSEQGEVSTRSVGMPAQPSQIAVIFQPSATEADIRSLLERLHARVIDGPSPSGVFTISLGAGSPAAALALLREQRNVVRSAEAVQP